MYSRLLLYRCLTLSAILLLLVTVADARSSVASTGEEPRLLEKGKPVERVMSGGESHSYQLPLTAGQFVNVVIDQRGIDLILVVFDSNGKQIAEVSAMNRQQGMKLLYLIADASGVYRLEIRSSEKDAPAGSYEVKVEELRVATSQDKSYIAAQRVFAEGERLRAQGTKESLLSALDRYGAVLPHWRARGDKEGEANTL